MLGLTARHGGWPVCSVVIASAPPSRAEEPIRQVVVDAGVVGAVIVRGVSSEPGNGKGNRNTNSDGRVYTETYEAEDASGNIGTAQALITVPHDMR